MSDPNTVLRELLDRREIYDLALRYARAADRRDYAAFAEIFTEDGRIAGHRGDAFATDPLYSLEGRDAILTGLRGLEQYEKTLHLVANQLLEIEGDRARGETYCTAHHIYRKGGAPVNHTMAIRYQDRFVRQNARWWLEERRLAIDWERHTSLGEDGWA